jgi:hypothetical protein
MIAPIHKELGPIIEAPGDVLTEGTTTLSGSLYTITLNSFEIAGTRSPQNDTDFVSMAVAVGGNARITLPTKSMGELSNGTYQVSLSIPNLDVSAKEAMAFSYAIFDSGYNKNAIEQALKTEVALAAKTAAAAGSRAASQAIGAEVGQEIGNFSAPRQADGLSRRLIESSLKTAMGRSLQATTSTPALSSLIKPPAGKSSPRRTTTGASARRVVAAATRTTM